MGSDLDQGAWIHCVRLLGWAKGPAKEEQGSQREEQPRHATYELPPLEEAFNAVRRHLVTMLAAGDFTELSGESPLLPESELREQNGGAEAQPTRYEAPSASHITTLAPRSDTLPGSFDPRSTGPPRAVLAGNGLRALLHRLGAPFRRLAAWRRRRRAVRMYAKAKKETADETPTEPTST